VARLSWGLVVATKDRIEPLKQCLTLALAQTRPPIEIIVVDASVEWQEHADALLDIVAPFPSVRLNVLPAPRPSSAVQRNVGINQASADILFLIDDDSFLYPTCAEEVLKIYEADTDEALAGVQLWTKDKPPGDVAEMSASLTYKDFGTMVGNTPWRQRLMRTVLVYGLKEGFIPYYGTFPRPHIPDNLKGYDVRPAQLFEGFRMTFRRKAIIETQFDPLLLYYCPGEDLDLSHRLSQTKCLVTAMRAHVHHFNSADARLKRYQVALLESLNQAVFLRRNALDQRQAQRRYTVLMCRRIVAEFIKDVGQGRFGLPKARGRARALWLSRRVFRASMAEVENFYPDLQEQIVKGTRHTA
jgi:glycosyltransferase involved in cell wall biosynthesis